LVLVVLYDCCTGRLPGDTPRSSALVGASRADRVLTAAGQAVVAAEVDRRSAVLVVEHGT
jgi:hypothetical protein